MSSSNPPISTHEIPPQVKQPAKLTEEERQRASPVQTQNLFALLLNNAMMLTMCIVQEIQNAREPKDGMQGTVPPAQEVEGYLPDTDE